MTPETDQTEPTSRGKQRRRGQESRNQAGPQAARRGPRLAHRQAGCLPGRRRRRRARCHRGHRPRRADRPHLAAKSEGDRLVTHLFESKLAGYGGWQWYAVLTRNSRSKVVTVDELGLLPSEDSILAPEWIPWAERVRPGDEQGEEELQAAAGALPGKPRASAIGAMRRRQPTADDADAPTRRRPTTTPTTPTARGLPTTSTTPTMPMTPAPETLRKASRPQRRLTSGWNHQGRCTVRAGHDVHLQVPAHPELPDLVHRRDHLQHRNLDAAHRPGLAGL